MAKKTIKEEEEIVSTPELKEEKTIDNLPKIKNLNEQKEQPVQVGHTTRAFRSQK
jgi:hypothetical protein